MARRSHGEGTISKRQDGTYEGKISLGVDAEGKRKRKTVYGKTKKEVLAKIDEVKQQLANGTFSDSKLTVKSYLEQWLTHKEKQVKPRTTELYRHLMEFHVIPKIGGKRLDKLTPLDIQNMVSDTAVKGGARTANMCRTVLYSALKQALRWGLIPRNPVEAVDALKEPKKDMTMWTSAEAVKFLDTARSHRLYPLFYLAMSTGMRRGELLGLRWQDVRAGSLHIRQSLTVVKNQIAISEPKTEKGKRRVAISPDLEAELSEHRTRQEAERQMLGNLWPDNDLVFRTEVGTPIHPRNLERTWYALQEATRAAWHKAAKETNDAAALTGLEAGKLMPKVRLHDLRHLHASLAIQQGMDAKMLADRLGHSRASFTLDVYTHLFEEQRANSAVSLSVLLGSKGPKN